MTIKPETIGLMVKFLTRGTKYRFVHRSSSQRVPRESVLKYLEISEDKKELILDGRPSSGTTNLPISWIQAIYEVNDQTIEPYTNRKLDPGERIY